MKEIDSLKSLIQASVSPYHCIAKAAGRLAEAGFSRLELGTPWELSAWRMLRPICFSLIKGKKLPGSFSIALQLRPDDAGNLIQKSGLGIAPETIQGLCLNIRYEDGRLMVTTATSLGFFTLDKSVDREWDEAVRRFFKEKEILYIEE